MRCHQKFHLFQMDDQQVPVINHYTDQLVLYKYQYTEIIYKV